MNAICDYFLHHPPRLPFCIFCADHAAPIAHSVFTAKLRQSLSHTGLKASNYSGHSFHRGGATFAFCCGAPTELISLWSSDAVLLYIAQPLERHLSAAHLITKNIISSSTSFFPFHYIFLFFLFFSFLILFFCLAVWAGHIQGGTVSISALLLPFDAALLFSGKQ